MKRLQGKVCIITGGASGMGKATAKRFVEEGAKVIVADFNEENGKKTVAELKELGGEAAFFKVDVSSWEQVQAMVDFAAEMYGTLDVVWNNAGIYEVYSVLDCNAESYERTVRVNQNSVAYGIFAASKKMVELGVKGVIINTSSCFATSVYANSFSYSATKAAIANMTKTAALELGEYGIRVIAIAPGTVRTPINQEALDNGLAEPLLKCHMRQQLCQPEDIANVVTFLASEESNVINGVVVPVDDGFISFKSF